FVVYDELLGRSNRFRRVRFVILDDKLNFLAQHPASLIDFLFRDPGALSNIIPRCSKCTGKRLCHADLDGILGEGLPRKQCSANQSEKTVPHYSISLFVMLSVHMARPVLNVAASPGGFRT